MCKLGNIQQWVKNNIRKLVFFTIFFLGFGTSSIWMSALFLSIDIKDIVIGLLTISIASVYTSAERILALMRKRKIEDNEDLIELIAVSAPIIISCVVIGFIENCIVISAIISILAYVSYCRLWWYQNRDNKNLGDSANALGGGLSQFNKQ